MIRLVVALHEEALPLVEQFALEPRPGRALFPVFANEQVSLTVCGVGRHKAAAAVAYLHALGGETDHNVWLNVGIAGHGCHPPGTLLSASRISDRGGQRTWYPPQSLLAHWRCSELICVDEPETRYASEALYDMESAGYYPIARRCSTAELVQCLKVVSDGPQHQISRVTGDRIAQLIADQAGEIERFARQLDTVATALAQRAMPHPDLDRVASACRPSVTQRHQLAQLLQRWRVLTPELPLLERALASGTRADRVIAHLRAELDALPVDLGA